ncbi:MAG: SCO family protein [Ferrovum sp.]|nr:SCO family protein [Ferrovum sp.]NDU86882.1 SCO family protein [Ferrovum sp.]
MNRLDRPPSENGRTSLILLIFLGALFLGGLGAFFLRQPTPPQGLGDRTQWLARGPKLANFSLPSTQGTLTQNQLQGHWTFILFGYTHCPDVCPTDLALLAGVVHSFATSQKTTAPPQVVFISVDPARDSLDILKRFVPAFDPSFIGAQADDTQLQPFAQTLGVYVVRHRDEADAQGNYTVDHSSAIFLFNPQGQLQASFQMPQTTARMFAETWAIMRH